MFSHLSYRQKPFGGTGLVTVDPILQQIIIGDMVPVTILILNVNIVLYAKLRYILDQCLPRRLLIIIRIILAISELRNIWHSSTEKNYSWRFLSIKGMFTKFKKMEQ